MKRRSVNILRQETDFSHAEDIVSCDLKLFEQMLRKDMSLQINSADFKHHRLSNVQIGNRRSKSILR
jgi:hypothetical protein